MLLCAAIAALPAASARAQAGADPAPVPPGEQTVVPPATPPTDPTGAPAPEVNDRAAYDNASREYQAHPDTDSAEALAVAASKIGAHREAAEHFAIALSLKPGMDASRRARLQTLLKAEKAHVATVLVKLSTDAKASILVDGIDVGTYPLKLPLYLDPGEHTFAVVAEEKRFVSVRVGVPADKSVTVTMHEAPADAKVASSEKPIWPAVVLGSLGGAALAVGIGTVAASFSRESEAEELGAEIGTCDLVALSPACLELSSVVSERNTLRNASTIAFISSGVFAAATIGYLFIPQAKETPAQGAPPAAVEWMVAPAVASDHVGVVVFGAF